MNQANITLPSYTAGSINLASSDLGASIVSVTDDFFATASRMLAETEPVFIPDKYDDNGKWMDGWESRRRRIPGHDHAVIRMIAPGQLLGFDVDTRYFTGNYPPGCSIEACFIENGDPDEDTKWTELVGKSDLGPDRHHFFQVDDETIYTHLRLNIFPDGGVARLRAFGKPHVIWDQFGDDHVIELSGLLNGGNIVAYNDAHYGAVHRLLAPGRGQNMGDGWETRRRREPGNDWIVIKLGARGVISAAEIDTAFFKGNYPDRANLLAADIDGKLDPEAAGELSENWSELLAEQKLGMDNIHSFSGQAIADIGPVTHVRMNIFPDGGVSRLRLFGKLAR